MSDFSTPSLPTLRARIMADYQSRYGIDALTRRDDIVVRATVQAGTARGMYDYLDWIADQVLVDRADEAIVARHGAIWGVARRLPSKARGTVTLTTSPGATILAGTLLQHPTAGDYTVTESVTATGASTTVAVEAVEAGAAGNILVGESLALVSPVIGVQSAGVVAGMGGGADIEGVEDWRARILERIRRPPHGGASHDYIAWAKEVPGVTRVWVHPGWLGPGTVGVIVVYDGRADIVPTAAEIAAMQEHLDTRRPVTADVHAIAPTPVPLDLSISIDPDTPEVRAAVAASADDYLRREAEPGGTIHLSRLREAISAAAGEYRHDLLDPVVDVPHTPGRIAVLGTIAWVV